MALIDTSEGSFFFDCVSDLVKKLRMAIVEEHAAINTYERLAAGARMMGRAPTDGQGKLVPVPEGYLSVEEAQKIGEFIDEIRNDEIQHTGKLEQLMCELDKNTEENMRKGRQGA